MTMYRTADVVPTCAICGEAIGAGDYYTHEDGACEYCYNKVRNSFYNKFLAMETSMETIERKAFMEAMQDYLEDNEEDF